jgi:TonB family protein
MKKLVLLILFFTASWLFAGDVYNAYFQLYVGAYESDQPGHVIVSLAPGQFTPMMGLGLVGDLQKTFQLKEMNLISAPKMQVRLNRKAKIMQGVQAEGKTLPFNNFTLELTPVASEGETVHLRLSVSIEDKTPTTMEFVTRRGVPVTLANRLNGHILFVICTIEEEAGQSPSPELSEKVNPVYPPEMKKAGVSGTVVLEVRIDKQGKPIKITPIKSPAPELAQAAIDAVKQWSWKPTVIDGKAVEVTSTITVKFVLQDK